MEKEKRYLIQELKSMGIKDKSILKAIEAIPREEFVPHDLKPFAYKNSPLAIGKEQTISQPYMVALMTELLEIKKGDLILEIGTGSGYQAAILHYLGAKVTSLERIYPLYERAVEKFKQLGYDIQCIYQDGFECNLLNQKFNKIIVTAALDSYNDLEKIESCLDQSDSILVVPIGSENDIQRLYQIIYHNNKRYENLSVYCRFVPLKKGLREA